MEYYFTTIKSRLRLAERVDKPNAQIAWKYSHRRGIFLFLHKLYVSTKQYKNMLKAIPRRTHEAIFPVCGGTHITLHICAPLTAFWREEASCRGDNFRRLAVRINPTFHVSFARVGSPRQQFPQKTSHTIHIYTQLSRLCVHYLHYCCYSQAAVVAGEHPTLPVRWKAGSWSPQQP